ncbi:MAG: hypothetical protein ABII79_02075 [bacterium]
MIRRALATAVVSLTVFLSMVSPIRGRAKLDEGSRDFGTRFASSLPYHCIAAHRVGKIVLSVNNNGTFGDGFAQATLDCFTEESVPSCEYPKGSRSTYLFAGAFWVGAVVGRDTLVSVGADGWQYSREMFPDEQEYAVIIKRSIIDPSRPEYQDAISEEDYIFVYTDTFGPNSNPPYPVDNDYFGRQHRPLNVELTQRSFAWSYSYAEDFVLFDYQIRNIGFRTLENVYMGLYVDADAYPSGGSGATGFTDDICGFLETIPTEFRGCIYEDTVNIAWIADNDGDMDAVGEDGRPLPPAPHVTAMRIVRTPAKDLDVSFNWWVSNGTTPLDFGPRERPFKGRWKEPYRDIGTGGLGTPEGDVNKYYFLRNKEFDYDQVYTASILNSDTLWLYPNQELAGDIADGFDTRYLLSFGPFDIDPGQTLPISFAYVAGENLHNSIANIDYLPHDPDAFYSGLQFDSLGLNSIWASKIYDNPGVDTDGDDYYGEFRVCVQESIILDSICDTTISDDLIDTLIVCHATLVDTILADTLWYKGDGVPDFRGASPPPAPYFWLEPTVGELRVRFNGQRSETTPDRFTLTADFEGYRIYLGRDSRAASYSVITSYDLEDYNKYVYDLDRDDWVLMDLPFSREQLIALYGQGDPGFDPLIFSPSSPFTHPLHPDSQFYFASQDYNQSQLGLPGGMRKVYPDQPYPSHLDADSARPEELTPDGYLKYFEYDYVIKDLLPTVSYWVNVTAFDFGSPSSGLPSLESSRTVGAKSTYPLSSVDEVAQRNLKVFIYPNPYRIDAAYRSLGLEGRESEIAGDIAPDNRVRTIHFANLPARCTIRIHTLDGDLVREIIHHKDPSDPNASHDVWDLITRNTQLVVSGLYYWSVEMEDGETQIGKLVIIM